MRLRPAVLAFFMVAFCAALFGLLDWQRRGRDFSDAELLRRLPDIEGSCLYLDVRALRKAGLLDMIAGHRADEEPEYKEWVNASGFDYREDLDTVMAHFGVDIDLYILRGRLSWSQISAYMKANDAKCSNGVCSIALSRGRFLSALPLSESVVALGTGTFRNVVYSVMELRERKYLDLPKEPFWVEFSEEYLKDPRRLPEGTRSFLSAVSGARHVFLAIAPEGNGLEARLRATFDSSAEAVTRRAKLEESTLLLRKFFQRDKQQPEESDIASLLLAGKFDQTNGDVLGRWPLPLTLFEKILRGR